MDRSVQSVLLVEFPRRAGRNTPGPSRCGACEDGGCSGTAPTYIGVGAIDLFVDENIDYT